MKANYKLETIKLPWHSVIYAINSKLYEYQKELEKPNEKSYSSTEISKLLLEYSNELLNDLDELIINQVKPKKH